MTSRNVSVWYDDEGDMLEVLWAFREGYFTPTDDDRILKRLDDDGQVIGFLIHEMSTLKQPSPVEFELDPEAPADDVANLNVKRAAERLGVSDRRVRQLAREGRIPGAVKVGQEWLIPTPVEVIPGSRGPVGVARQIDAPVGAMTPDTKSLTAIYSVGAEEGALVREGPMAPYGDSLWDEAKAEVAQLRENDSPVYRLLIRLTTRLNQREQELERVRNQLG